MIFYQRYFYQQMISFGEPKNDSPKAFLLTLSKASYRTFVRRRRLFPRLRVFLEVYQLVEKYFFDKLKARLGVLSH